MQDAELFQEDYSWPGTYNLGSTFPGKQAPYPWTCICI